MKPTFWLILILFLLGQANIAQEADKPLVELGSGSVWKRHAIDNSSQGADGVKLGDINDDGLTDMVTGWEEGGKVRLYLHPGHADVRPTWPSVTVSRVRDAEDAILADLDGDGQLEVIICTEGNSRAVFWGRFTGRSEEDLLNPENWTTAAFPATKGKQLWMQAVAMDVDGLHGDDLVLASKGKGGAIGWLQAPETPADLHAWRYHLLREAGWIMSLIPHDMNGDGHTDLVLTDRKGPRSGVFWLENPGPQAARAHAEWKERVIGGQGREVMFADIADLNGDGRDDVIAAVKPTEVMVFFERKGEWQQQSLHLITDNLGSAKAVKAADINGSGLTDLVFTCEHAGSGRDGVVWLEQQENGAWKQHSLGGPAGVKFDNIQLLDLDKNGRLDVVTCEERDQLGVVWYENPQP